MQFFHQKFLLTTVLPFIVCLSCAHQQYPTGGPDDTSGPLVVATSPVSGSVGIQTDASVEIAFSEWIHPSSVKGISLFPSIAFKTRVKGNRLIVKPFQRFADSTTYHLIITSTLKDLHNNALSNPVNIIFSTGSMLDKGYVSGCVTDPTKERIQPNVALFSTPMNANDSGFCGTPDYLVQTDSCGYFSFIHIREGVYHLLAYTDKNSDYHLQEKSEEIYLAKTPTIATDNVPEALMLFPSVFDTSRLKIESISVISNMTITGIWKKPFDSTIVSGVPVFHLETSDTSQRRIIPVNPHLNHGSSRFLLTTGSVLDSIAYLLVYTIKSVLDSAEITDTIRISGYTTPDTIQPKLLKSLPNSPAEVKTSLSLIWSEPVRIDSSLILVDTLNGDTIALFGDTLFSDTSSFPMPRSLLPGHCYRVVIFTSSGYDRGGNALKSKDSTDTAAIVTFAVLTADSLAVSLSGTSSCLEKSANRKWMFNKLSGSKPFIVNDTENGFRFDSISHGKGRLITFIDTNNNNKPDPGNLMPFTPPEPVIMFPDTIEARARWDIEGISLAPCSPCEQKLLESQRRSAEITDTSSTDIKK